MKRFIITAALGAGLLVTPLFTSAASAAQPDQIHFQKVTEHCSQTYTITGPHWTPDFNPSMANRALHDFDRDVCGKLTDVNAGAEHL